MGGVNGGMGLTGSDVETAAGYLTFVDIVGPTNGVLTGTARQNAFAAAVSTYKISLLTPQGIVTSS